MSSAFWAVVALGCGCAANPWGIMCAVLLLDARRGPVVVWAYVAAWIVSLGVVVVVLVGGLTTVTSSADGAGTAAAWAELALGVVLLAFGVRRIAQRAPARPGERTGSRAGSMRSSRSRSSRRCLLGIYSATYPFAVAAAAAILASRPTAAEAAALSARLRGSRVGLRRRGCVRSGRSPRSGRIQSSDVYARGSSATTGRVLTAILLAFGVVLTAHGLRGVDLTCRALR